MYSYLFVNGLIFLVVGLRGLFKPVETVATPYGLIAEEVDARNYLRGGAGGVVIAAGALQIAGVLLPSLALAALLMVVTLLGGMVGGRLVSLVLDGRPSLVPWIAGGFEALGLVLGGYWLWVELTR